MRIRSTWVWAAALLLILPYGVAAAQAQEQRASTSGTKPANRKLTARTAARSATDRNHQAAPCARGTWKDDPVCFGEGEPNALPTPSTNSVRSNSHSNELSIKPTANLNSRTPSPGGGMYHSGVTYQSNGNIGSSGYEGGMKVDLPF